MAAARRPVLVAPDSFKGTLSSTEVAEAVGRGLADEGFEVDLMPLADGGEGTLDVLLGALGGRRVEVEAHDALGRPVSAQIGVTGEGTAIVETAQAIGLPLIAEEERDPEAASSFGAGELIAAAVETGAETVVVAVGGSATTDGGAGAIEAIEATGGAGKAKLVVCCDAQTPFERAAIVFGPQKGADEACVARLTARLEEQAAALPRDPTGVPMTGAAGGLAGGLWAAFGAELTGGAGFVLDALDADRRMRASRAVVVGEGRLDMTTLEGKAAGELAVRARQAGVPAFAVVGQDGLDLLDRRILDLHAVIEAGTKRRLRAAGRKLAEYL
ncbi:MAG: glycerate kinase [Solirubrobacterales bacterium]